MSSTNNVHVLELSAYTQPEIIENTRSEWVEYGKDNLYYDYLIQRYRNSATLNAVINNVSKLTYGRGLYAKNASLRPTDFAQMKVLFSNETLRNVAMDYKMFGNACFQVVYADSRKKVSKVIHTPMNLLRPEKCDDKGSINAYYYSDNWAEPRKFIPKRIPVFGTSKENIELVIIGGYSPGRKYFNAPDYEGCLDYAFLEEKISEYLVNEVENGFSGTKVVNFNNGIPSEEEQRVTASTVKRKLTGSRGEKVIVAFNMNETQKTTVDDIPLNDAPEHYQYLSDESRNKILVGNNITSPMLVGISPDGQGFSSNAEEIETASKYFYNTVIKYYQDAIIEGIDLILAYNGVSLDLFFRRLNLFEDIEAVAQQQEEAQLKMNKCCIALSSDEDEAIAKKLIDKGETIGTEWTLIAESDVDYNENDTEPSLLRKLVNLVSTGTARPNTKSGQDETIDGVKFITRYKYNGDVSNNSRLFCKKMVGADKVYRKEDIINMGSIPVNEGWGANGADTYSIWLYKGGGNCQHTWKKQIYASFEGVGIDVNSPKAKQLIESTASKYGYTVTNASKVAQRPADMPHFGFLPTNPTYGK
jgi:hypothetical protein